MVAVFWDSVKGHHLLDRWHLVWFTQRYGCSGVVAEWSKVLTAAPWPRMVWSTLSLGTYQLRFVSLVFHVIFSFVHFISLYTLRAFRKPLPYTIYLFNIWIANHILIKMIFCCFWHLFQKNMLGLVGRMVVILVWGLYPQ